ncbi:MAG TPA: glutathione S-transferase N-terminal domain-containing protein [Albitalea sp.]|nr:glutathione S-transferase N-terminal domain-containing protein [Albitalea sp.]
MKLYLAPGACSLSEHIALLEAGLPFERVIVDLRSKRTQDGRDYNEVNPKGYVPALVLDDGQTLTENVAILDWIADRCPRLAPTGELAHSRMLEMLAFISTEIHKQFVRVFFPTGDPEKQAALQKIGQRLAYIADRLKGDYLLGGDMTVADAYLYVMLRWAQAKGCALPPPLPEYKARMERRESVKSALAHESGGKA